MVHVEIGSVSDTVYVPGWVNTTVCCEDVKLLLLQKYCFGPYVYVVFISNCMDGVRQDKVYVPVLLTILNCGTGAGGFTPSVRFTGQPIWSAAVTVTTRVGELTGGIMYCARVV